MLGGPIDDVIVIQGAPGGSPVADGVHKELPLSALLFPVGGLYGLSTIDSRKIFADALTTFRQSRSPDDVDALFHRVFYVRASTERAVARS